MSGSRKSLQRAAQTFNPRAENSWSKDDSKFGQRMLEKMGWKKGEGIGRDGQGVKENIKIRWKLDSKGLGFSIKEDEWVAVEHDFSKLLSNLNKDCSTAKTTVLSLESTSSSSRSRMHYRKFIRGKDVSKYSKKDLSGILGENAEVNDDRASDHSDNKTGDSSAVCMEFLGTSDQLLADENSEEMAVDLNLRNGSENEESDKTLATKLRDRSSVKKRRKRKTDSNVDDFDHSVQKVPELHDDENCSEMAYDDSNLRNGSESVESDETLASASRGSSSTKKRRKDKVRSDSNDFDPFMPIVTKLRGDENCEETANSDSNLKNGLENVDSDQTPISELRSPSSAKKRRKKKVGSIVDDFDHLQEVSKLHNDENCGESANGDSNLKNGSVNVELDIIPASESRGSSAKKRRKDKVRSKSNDFDHVMKLQDENCEEMANGESNLKNGSENVESDVIPASESRGSLSKKKRRKDKLVSSSDDFDPFIPNEPEFLDERDCEGIANVDSNLENCSETIESDKTPAPELSGPSSVKKRRKVDSNVDDFDQFMLKVAEFNASTDPKAVIEEFERNKEALLKKYRESYFHKYLDSANENDCRIYCDLNGDELDCKNVRDEGNCDESSALGKIKNVRERAPTKAERIVRKARLLKSIQNKSCSHSFSGSNLTDIIGYGNNTVTS